MIKTLSPIRLLLLIISLSFGMVSAADSATVGHPGETTKALIIGDSMAGWLGDRLNAYGQANGFEVGTVVWDGATIKKYADSSNLKKIIDEQDPQVVFICLGMNDLADPAPEHLQGAVDRIRAAVGDRRLIWLGPPSWPGKPQWTKLNTWLENTLGAGNYFNTYPLNLPRQSATNPHPTKEGIITWCRAIAEWLPTVDAGFNTLKSPAANQMTRSKFFLYKKIKEKL